MKSSTAQSPKAGNHYPIAHWTWGYFQEYSLCVQQTVDQTQRERWSVYSLIRANAARKTAEKGKNMYDSRQKPV